MSPRPRLLYALLVLVRILIAFTSHSFIHPDEHFQNSEVAAGIFFDFGAAGEGLLKTWEWDGEAPCRSIVPVWASTGFSFAVLSVISANPSARAFFLAERAVMLLYSFALDYLIWTTSRSPTAVLLLASSPVTFTFLLRPFSNTLETLLVAATALLVKRVASRPSHGTLVVLGAILLLGVFTRITFVAFAAPLVLITAYFLSLRVGQKQGNLRALVDLVLSTLPVVLSFAVMSLSLALADTFYFSSTLSPSFSSLILTPLNLLRYNLSADNLASHGLHPRYLHVVANWPMLFGAGLAIIFSAGLSRSPHERVWRRVLLASFIVPTLLLSIQPHQEPRFLLPLIVPLTLLAPHAPFLQEKGHVAARRKKVFWIFWLIHSLFFTIIFGYLHQGGLLPALFRLNDDLRDSATALGSTKRVDLVFWRTFMPPRHLLLPLSDGRSPIPAVFVTDLAGSPPSLLSSTLDALMFNLTRNGGEDLAATSRTIRLVAPAYAIDQFDLGCLDSSKSTTAGVATLSRSFCLSPAFDETLFGVHVDMDRIGDIFSARSWGKTGVGVWEVRRR